MPVIQEIFEQLVQEGWFVEDDEDEKPLYLAHDILGDGWEATVRVRDYDEWTVLAECATNIMLPEAKWAELGKFFSRVGNYHTHSGIYVQENLNALGMNASFYIVGDTAVEVGTQIVNQMKRHFTEVIDELYPLIHEIAWGSLTSDQALDLLRLDSKERPDA